MLAFLSVKLCQNYVLMDFSQTAICSLTENSSKFPISFELDSGVWREFYQTVLNIQRSD